jgi:hypothetical protein
LAKFQLSIDSKVKAALTAAQAKAIQFSESGCVYDLTIVGTAAKPSARMLNVIATFPSLVTAHSNSPRKDRTPQVTSKLVSFQTDFLFTKEAARTRSGLKPAAKVIRDCRPTPLDSSAAKATSGAKVHISQLTLLGRVFPISVSRTYVDVPRRLIITPIITNLSLIINT